MSQPVSMFTNSMSKPPVFSKKESCLIDKIIAARTIKTAAKTKRGINETTLLPQSPQYRPSTSVGAFSPIKTSNNTSHSFSTTSLPQLSPTTGTATKTFEINDGDRQEINKSSHNADSTSVLAKSQVLIDDLASRGVTDVTAKKKLTISMAKTMQSKFASQKSTLKFNDNYFMPKRTIQRPDGATLTEVYQSKRADTWASILKAQLRDEEEEKIVKRQEKLKADEDFGKKLKAQLDDNHRRFLSTLGSDDKFAQIEEERSKKSDDVQRKRREDAVNRQKQFINHALEDIETKRLKREAEFLKEMEASQMMIAKTKYLIAQDEQKKIDKKAHEAKLNERLYQENLDSIARKEAEKLKRFDEDKKIIAVQLRNYEKMDERREEDLQKVFKRATDGPAHQIVAELVKKNKVATDNLYHTLLTAGDGLNKQLLDSEEATKKRLSASCADLKDSWDIMNAIHAKERKEEQMNLAKILAYNNNKLKQMAAEDEKKFQDKKAAHAKYKYDLDNQLNELQRRSLDSLTKTMSEREIKFNADLIRKTGVNLNF